MGFLHYGARVAGHDTGLTQYFLAMVAAALELELRPRVGDGNSPSAAAATEE